MTIDSASLDHNKIYGRSGFPFSLCTKCQGSVLNIRTSDLAHHDKSDISD